MTPSAPPTLKGKVTLVRWFTDGCAFCETSLPAIMTLKNAVKHPDFQTVAVYHAKPPRPVALARVADHARHLGYDGPLAADSEWTELKRQYLDDHPKAVTSVTFLLDRTGTIRYIHPGPVYGPSKTDAALNTEYKEVHQAVRAMLESN